MNFCIVYPAQAHSAYLIAAQAFAEAVSRAADLIGALELAPSAL